MDNAPITASLLLHLAQLPSLQTLRANTSTITQDEWQPPGASDGSALGVCFSRLVELALTHQSMLTASLSIIKALHSPALQSMSVTVRDGTISTRLLKELFEALVASPAKLNLRSVYVEGDRLEEDDAVTSDTLSPLATLRGLTRVAVWELTLGPEVIDESFTSPLDLVGLLPLARRCPALTTLAVAIHADALRIPHSYHAHRPGKGSTQTALTSLDVGQSRIHDEVVVASFLSDVFPDLHRVVDTIPDKPVRWMTLMPSGWRAVGWYYIPMFVRLRK
ncbi:hypothetical protein C8Q73DRAFT_792099 [Cubamyces lactineus]|nr:hypothetical protein C8Q73DRAFT_792099 [Cubamyces lactineus]